MIEQHGLVTVFYEVHLVVDCIIESIYIRLITALPIYFQVISMGLAHSTWPE